jgi:PKD repeat protein
MAGAPAGGAGTAGAPSDDCVVVVDVNPDFGPPPLTVAFTAEAECGQGATYKWDFGDGSPPSTEAHPSHTYAKDGDYTASVTVTAANGGTASDEIDIFVEEE